MKQRNLTSFCACIIGLLVAVPCMRAQTKQTSTYGPGDTYTLTYDLKSVVPYNGHTWYDIYYVTNNSTSATLDLVWTATWTIIPYGPGSPAPVAYSFSAPEKIAPGYLYNMYIYVALQPTINDQQLYDNTFALVYAQPDSKQTFNTQPASQTVNVGSTLAFSLSVGGQSSTFVWYHNGAAITGALSTATLSIPNVTASASGTYYCVASNPFYTVDSSTATVTVNTPPLQAQAPTSQNTTDSIDLAWTPPFSGGSGGTDYFCVSGYTNWQAGPWTPAAAGTYTFFVATHCSPGYTGNDLDPVAGELEVNYTAYTLTITDVATAPTSQNATDSPGVAWKPMFFGGSGGTDYFCVAGFTNWQSGTWTPTAAGTYSFYVATHCSPGVNGNDLDPTAGELEVNYTTYSLTVP